MTRTRTAWALALCAGLAVTMLSIPSSHAVAEDGPGVDTGSLGAVTPLAKSSERKKNKAGRYTPTTGIKINHPLRPKMRRNINAHILKSIKSTPRGAKIRMISWNVRSGPYRRALLKAHNRGVSVRILMSKGVASRQAPNQDYGILKRGLKKGNAKRTAAMKSWMRTCRAACRGPNGIAHAKWFIFSKAGKARWVVMAGSANLTEVASYNQWNDVYTVTGNRGLYTQFEKVFGQAARDKTARPAYVQYQASPGMKAWFLPYRGKKATGDPVLKMLQPVVCSGAKGAGINGKTAIRVAQTAILDARGQAIAKRLKYLHNHGCDVKIIYTVLGPDVSQILRRNGGHGGIPMRQIAQDFDDDGSFDRYLHMKTLTISGHYGGDTGAHRTYNGSQNWTAVGLVSDEAGFILKSIGVERKYARWINELFAHPPRNPNPRTALSVPRSVRYSEVEIN
jgi:phosphatidylserine/phosphatidylglycerophosphate/cardiolipin synthase-like enzyme